jgi:uncharacterized protein with FMN-binding domain
MKGKKNRARNILLLLFPLGLLLSLPGCLGSGFIREAGYTPGVYEGVSRGYRGPIYVQIQISPAGIEDIVITSHEETVYPGAAAMEELLELIIETGSTELDAVSGATYSSKGFLEAVEDALEKAAASSR